MENLERSSDGMFASEVGSHPRPHLISSNCASVVIHTLAMLILINIGLFQPISFVARAPRLLARLVSTPSVASPTMFRPLALPAPPKFKSDVASRTQLEPPVPAFVAPVLPSLVVEMATPPGLPVFSPASVTVRSAADAPNLVPTIRPPRQVQTGGFGDPNGIGGKGQDARPTIARLGSFGLPPGPGTGNGTGARNGVPRMVITSQFAGGVETPPGATATAPRPTTRPAGFPEIAAPVADAGRSPVSTASPRTTPAEILSKPIPNYTAAARAIKLEGEVWVQVLLPASGGPKALRIIRGLGHGLDEAAAQAVEGIAFKPAQQEGRPVDSTVVIFVVFQLT